MMSDFCRNEDGIYTRVHGERTGKIYYPDLFTDICFRVEETNFWFNNRNDIISQAVQHFSPDSIFADIGAGNGYQVTGLLKKLPSLQYYLVEPNYNGCINASTRGLDKIYNCMALDFDYKEANVGAVGLFDVIEHIAEDSIFMRELADTLPLKSYVYITVPSYQMFWNDMDEITGHFRRYTRSTLSELGKTAGLTPVYSSYFFSYLTLPYLLFRVGPYRLGSRLNQEEVIQSELKAHSLSALVSAAFSPLHRMEMTMFHHKKPIPFGNSCIAVFQKQHPSK